MTKKTKTKQNDNINPSLITASYQFTNANMLHFMQALYPSILLDLNKWLPTSTFVLSMCVACQCSYMSFLKVFWRNNEAFEEVGTFYKRWFLLHFPKPRKHRIDIIKQNDNHIYIHQNKYVNIPLAINYNERSLGVKYE